MNPRTDRNNLWDVNQTVAGVLGPLVTLLNYAGLNSGSDGKNLVNVTLQLEVAGIQS